MGSKTRGISAFFRMLGVFALAAVVFSSAVSCKSKKGVIGIVQFGSHSALDSCREGAMSGLRKSGIDLNKYEIRHFNCDFKSDECLLKAKELVASNADVIIAIATPAAVQVASAVDGSGIPMVYCAVTDSSKVKKNGNCTGVSDIPDFDAQMKLVYDFMGQRRGLRIGTLMSMNEPSDLMQLKELREAAKPYGASVMGISVANINTIALQTRSLITSEIDCIVNLLDNSVVSKLDKVLAVANFAGVPVFGSEVEQVRLGCLASASLDYEVIGENAGSMAAQILKGRKANEIQPLEMTGVKSYYNSKVSDQLGLSGRAAQAEAQGVIDVVKVSSGK